MRIFVGNLSHDVSDQDLQAAFESFGSVDTATVVRDKFTGDSRGFGFVEMPAQAEAQAAISGMNGKDLKGRAVNVNEARPREDRGGGGFGGGRSGGGGRPGGGGRSGGGGGRRF